MRFLFVLSCVISTSLFFGAYAFASPTTFFVDPQYDQLGRHSVDAALRMVSNKAFFYVEEEFFQKAPDAYRKELDDSIQRLAREFDNRIFPELEKAFGSSGIAQDNKLTVFIVRTRPDVGGYFNKNDLVPKTAQPTSNERSMIYLNLYRVTHGAAPAYLAHEFQHLITHYQKNVLRGLDEEMWLDELYSEYAPTLLGYNTKWDGSHIESRVYDFLQNPQISLLGWSGSAPNHGAVALFASYVGSQYGNDVFLKAFSSQKIGIASIEEALLQLGIQKRFWELHLDWLLANVLNNSIDGIHRYSYRSPVLHYGNFHLLSNVSYRVDATKPIVSQISLNDWEHQIIRFTPAVVGKGGILKIVFRVNGPEGEVRIPYIVNSFSEKTTVSYLLARDKSATLLVHGFSDQVSSIIVILTNQKKYAGFAFEKRGKDSTVSFEASLIYPKDQMQLITILQDYIRALSEQLLYMQAVAQLDISQVRYQWDRDLYFGLMGDVDVKALQRALLKDGVYNGPITGNFLTLTRAAVIAFQKKYSIEPSIGYVGAKTRSKLNKIFGG